MSAALAEAWPVAAGVAPWAAGGRARDLPCDGVVRVAASARWRDLALGVDAIGAVHDDEDADGRFLGLVTDAECARFPSRILADVARRFPTATVDADAPLDVVEARLAAVGARPLAVLDRGGRCVGAVTREGLLRGRAGGVPAPALAQVRRLEALGLLGGSVVHDVNNLLMIVRGNAGCLLSELDRDHPHHQLAREIETAMQHAAAVTRRFLAFGREAASAAAADLNAAVANVLPLVNRAAGERVVAACDLDPAAPWVAADPGLLEQALLNLALNACDAMPGGGRLAVHTWVQSAPPEGTTGDHDGAWAVLAVSDTGHGMDEATRARIFEPFFTTKPPGRGTGLGLLSVRELARLGRGVVRVASTVGEGTTFRVYLPAVPAPRGCGGT